MSTEAPSGGVKPEGSAFDPEALKKLIHDTINEVLPKAVHARVTRTEESLAEIVKGELAKLAPQGQQKKPEDEKSTEERLTTKALNEKIEGLMKALQDRDRKVQEAEQRATQTRVGAEVRGLFSKYLGPDSPDLDPYVSHYMSQFVDKDGKTYHKAKDAYDIETVTPADEAVAEWFTKGALKSKIQQSKATQMPRIGGGTGQSWTPPKAPQTQAGVNPLELEVIEAMGKDRPELAQEMYKAALAQAEARNGSNQK